MQKQKKQKILVPVDGSENAAGAVKFVGALLGGFDYEVSLFHVIRSNGTGRPEHRHIFSSKEFAKVVSKEMASSLKAAQTELIHAGFKAKRI